MNESKDRGHCIFPKEHPKVTDGNDHFPINDVAHARNALARAAQYDKKPNWFKGSLKELQDIVKKTVHKEFPSIEVSGIDESLASSLANFPKSLNEARRYEFQSAITRGGNPILPEVIVIENGVITWSKRKVTLIGKDIKSMKIEEVTQMDLDVHVIGVDFIIYGRGNNTIEAHNFTEKDAMKIKTLLKV